MNDSKGTSLVIVRTNQGEKIFNRLISKSSVKVMEVEYDDATKKIQQSSVLFIDQKREKLFYRYEENGF